MRTERRRRHGNRSGKDGPGEPGGRDAADRGAALAARLSRVRETKEQVVADRAALDQSRASDVEDLRDARCHADLQIAELEQAETDLDWAGQVLQDFDAAWALLTPENRCRLVRALVKQVTVDDSEGIVTVELLEPTADHAADRERYRHHHEEDRP